MNVEYILNKKLFRFILLFLFIMVLLGNSESYASTIDISDISINIDTNGKCNIEEMLYITGIDEGSAYTWNYAPYPSIQLTRGGGVEDLYINNLKLSDYYNEWWYNRDKYYDTYTDTINLFYPKQSRKVSILFEIHKKSEDNFL